MQERLKRYFRELVTAHTDEHDIALGFAIGTFIGIVPTPFISFPLGLLVVLLYPKVNKLALFGSLVLWNPFTMAPFYYLNYQVGALLFGGSSAEVLALLNDFSFRHLLSTSATALQSYLIGSLIVASIVALLGYVGMRSIVHDYYKRKARLERENRVQKSLSKVEHGWRQKRRVR